MLGTIIAGVFIASIIWLLQKNIFEPVQAYKKKLGEISNMLKYYAPDFSNDRLEGDELAHLRSKIRKLSCDLDELYWYIPHKKLLMGLWFSSIKEEKNISDAGGSLIFLSNIVGQIVETTKRTGEPLSIESYKHVLKIKKNLGLFMQDSDIVWLKKQENPKK